MKGLDQLDKLLDELSTQEIESIFDDESSSVNTNATSLNPPDSKSFHSLANNMQHSGEHATLVLDCLQDMLRNEISLLEETLASFTEELSNSVPMNSYNCKVFPLRPFAGPKK